MTLYAGPLSRPGLAARTGNLSQVAGVRLMTLGDGVERGIRMLEFRTGSGLRFTVLVDRAMDLAEVEHNGRAVGWHSPTGFRNAALHEYEGEGGLAWARSFSGMLVTCGLDHILRPEDVPAESYDYPGRKTVRHSLHGRVGTIPARLTGYGEAWDGDRCLLWAEGVVVQAAVFGEVLHLHRRIEADLGGDEIRITDRVVNAGFSLTPHMLFYHINVGYPVIDEGTRYLAPITDVLWASHAGAEYRAQGVGYDRCPPPLPRFREQVWQHAVAADPQGWVPVALVNDRLQFGVEVSFRHDQLPCLYEWQNFHAGNYVVGIEPSTHHVLGNNAARARDEMIWLDAGEERPYFLVIRVLPDAVATAAATRRIAEAAVQPSDPYPDPSGRFPRLAGRARPTGEAARKTEDRPEVTPCR